MFCPKCGAESIEDDQRYCKSCGTNLKAINDVLEKGDSKPNVFGVDLEGIVESVKKSVGEVNINKDLRPRRRRSGREPRQEDNYNRWLEYEQTRTKVEEERVRRQQLRQPKPKEWMSYSWQHNLKAGLMSLLSGAGFGIFLYYFGRIAIDSGLLLEIAPKMEVSATVLEPFARMLWLFAAIPVLKGLGQIAYAAFFAESMATLTERFASRALSEAKDEKFLFTKPPTRDTAPQADLEPAFDDATEAPPSVTESTTRTLAEARARREQV